MILLKKLIQENQDADFIHFEPSSFDDLYDLKDSYQHLALSEISNGVEKQQWKVVPAGRIHRIWKTFGEKGIIRDTKGLSMITSLILHNTIKLAVNNVISGHESHGIDQEELEEYGFKSSEDLWDRVGDYITDENGVYRISDYGLPKLFNIVEELYKNPNSATHVLYSLDKMLNVVHQRSDLSKWFIEGGAHTLDAISS